MILVHSYEPHRRVPWLCVWRGFVCAVGSLGKTPDSRVFDCGAAMSHYRAGFDVAAAAACVVSKVWGGALRHMSGYCCNNVLSRFLALHIFTELSSRKKAVACRSQDEAHFQDPGSPQSDEQRDMRQPTSTRIFICMIDLNAAESFRTSVAIRLEPQWCS